MWNLADFAVDCVIACAGAALCTLITVTCV